MTPLDLLYAAVVALILILAALGVGASALRLLNIEERGLERLWMAAACGLGTISVSTLLLGLAGLLYAAFFAVLLAVPTLLGLLALARYRPTVGATRTWFAPTDSGWPLRAGGYLLLLLSATTVIWILLAQALMPPHEWDELVYHLTVPERFLREHRVYFIPYICLSLWPMNSEMLFSIALLFGSDVATHLVMLSMALLTVLGLMVTARRSLDSRIGLIAAALFLSVPLVKRLAGTGLIDISLGLYVLSAVAALDRWQEQRRWPWLVLSALFCGFAAGSKLSGIAFVPLIGVLVLIHELRQRPLRIGTALGYPALFGVVALLVVAPWYLRSFVATGNPIWPFAYHLFGGRAWDALGAEYLIEAQLDVISPNPPRTPVWLLRSSIDILLHPFDYGRFPGGLGVVAPVGTLAAAALTRHAPRLLRQSLFICGSFYLLWFIFLPLQLRFLMPILPLMTFATAYLFVWLYDALRLPALRWALVAGLLVVVARESPWLSTDDRALLQSHVPVLRGQVSREDWIDAVHKGHRLIRYANAELPADAKILLIPYETRTYHLDRDYVWGCLTCQRVIPFEQFDSPAALATTLRDMGITHVIDNPAVKYDRLRYWQRDRELMLALRDQCGQPLYQQDDAVLYALGECAAAAKADQHH